MLLSENILVIVRFSPKPIIFAKTINGNPGKLGTE